MEFASCLNLNGAAAMMLTEIPIHEFGFATEVARFGFYAFLVVGQQGFQCDYPGHRH